MSPPAGQMISYITFAFQTPNLFTDLFIHSEYF